MSWEEPSGELVGSSGVEKFFHPVRGDRTLAEISMVAGKLTQEDRSRSPCLDELPDANVRFPLGFCGKVT